MERKCQECGEFESDIQLGEVECGWTLCADCAEYEGELDRWEPLEIMPRGEGL